MILVSESDDRFYISDSTQPDAGRGLFAARDIAEGEHLEVVGVMVDRDSPADLCTAYADAFKFAADYEGSYTRHIIPMGYAGIINHANDRKDQNVEIRHVGKAGRTKCVYHFIRGVSKGEEILGDYGEGWKGLAEWSGAVNGSADESEEREWLSFLGRGLYNLDKLKKPKEQDAADK